jgi:hypothetical protein
MATVLPPKSQTWDRTETDTRIRHPLHKLRSYIRTYVILEGLSVFLIYLAVWFWVGLLLDYGVFMVTGFDWVEQMPTAMGSAESFTALRASIVIILVAGLIAVVAVKVLLRLLREFRDDSLALVLERRFPDTLGDRLITAVEMADPNLSAVYGHSQPMVDQTIRDAAARVDRLPVGEVFKWYRLLIYGAVVLGLTVGMFLLSAVTYMVVSGRGVSRFLYYSRDVASIWTERNLLFQNSLWLKDNYFELIRFRGSKKDKDEMRVSESNPKVDIWVRASQWVVADDDVPGGWRPLLWKDLADGELLGYQPVVTGLPDNWAGWAVDVDGAGVDIPAELMPEMERWNGKTIAYAQAELYKGTKAPELLGITLPRPRSIKEQLEEAGVLEQVERNLFHWRQWTVDRIALQMNKKDIRLRLRSENPDACRQIEDVLARLQEIVDEGDRERKLRYLDVPKTVEYYAWTEKNETDHEPLTSESDNKLRLKDLEIKETVHFVVRGGDFTTPEKRIRRMPPPRVDKLTTTKKEPAYLYYRLRGAAGDLAAQKPLKGRQLEIVKHDPNVTEGTIYIEVAMGSDLVLVAETNETLKDRPRIEWVGGDDSTRAVRTEEESAPPAWEGPGRRQFKKEFKKVTQTKEFYFKFTNEDNVDGQCLVKIEPRTDLRPEVSLQPVENVFRKKPNTEFYMVTPRARVPFRGFIRDDRGINRVDWTYTVQAVEREGTQARLQAVLTAYHYLPGGMTPQMVGPAYLRWLMLRMTAVKKSTGDKDKDKDKETPAEVVLHKNIKDEVQLRAVLADGAMVSGTSLLRKYVEEAQHLQDKEIDPDRLAEIVKKNPPADPVFLRQIALNPDDDVFNFKEVLRGLETPRHSALQLRCLVEIGMTAADSNVEVEDPVNEPSATKSKQTFTFLVVGENELLSEIFREEEDLRGALEEIQKKLSASHTKLSTQVVINLGDTNPDRRGLMATRTSEVKTVIGMSGRDVGAILASFNRIEQELELNDVQKDSISRVRDQICKPLARILDKNNGQFKLAEDAAEKLQNILEGKDNSAVGPAGADAKKKLDDLMVQIGKVLEAMQKIIDKDALIRIAVEMEEKQRKQTEAFTALEDFLTKDAEKELEGKDLPSSDKEDDEKKPPRRKRKPTDK